MKFVICDDEKIFLKKLSEKIKFYLVERGVDAELKICSRGKDLLGFSEKIKIDAFFLDIDMPEINGFQIAKNIRTLYPNCIIVFCSNHNELVYESFEYEPFGFCVNQIMRGD